MSPLEELHLPGDHLALGDRDCHHGAALGAVVLCACCMGWGMSQEKEGKRENKSYNTTQYNKLKSNEGPENQG